MQDVLHTAGTVQNIQRRVHRHTICQLSQHARIRPGKDTARDQRFHSAVSHGRMRQENTAAELDELPDMPDNQDSIKACIHAHFDRITKEIAAPHLTPGQRRMIPHKELLPVIAERQE